MKETENNYSDKKTLCTVAKKFSENEVNPMTFWLVVQMLCAVHSVS